VREDVSQGDPLRAVFLEHSKKQRPDGLAQGLRETRLRLGDATKLVFDRLPVEGEHASHQGVEHDAEAPDIDGCRVALLRNIRGRAAR
jgi:hypothetical protein